MKKNDCAGNAWLRAKYFERKSYFVGRAFNFIEIDLTLIFSIYGGIPGDCQVLFSTKRFFVWILSTKEQT